MAGLDAPDGRFVRPPEFPGQQGRKRGAGGKLSSRDIRQESRMEVLHALLSAGSSTRSELARHTGLSVATVATIVTELLDETLLVEAGVESGVAGRPTTVLRINEARGIIIGVDVAETYVRAVVFDSALGEIDSVEVPLDESLAGVEHVAAGVVGAVTAAIEATGVERSKILGTGVALPGLVWGKDGFSGVIPSWAWRSDELLQRLRDGIRTPLVVENPLKAIAIAELWLGLGRSASNTVIVNLGTGVGTGIILDGRILRGASNSAGEWGHALLSMDGRLCRCGRRGCVEAYIGAPGIHQTLQEISPGHPLLQAHQADFIEGLAHAALEEQPDPAVVETLARTSRYLGYALADIAAIINPEQLMLTGWTAWLLGETLLPGTWAALRERAPRGSASGLELGVSTVRGNSVAIGVAILAFERFLGEVGFLTSRPTVVG